MRKTTGDLEFGFALTKERQGCIIEPVCMSVGVDEIRGAGAAQQSVRVFPAAVPRDHICFERQ